MVAKADLSPRQDQIVALLFKGYGDKQIALELGLSLPTVRTHMTRLFGKIGVSDRCNLLIHFFKLAQTVCDSVDCPLKNHAAAVRPRRDIGVGIINASESISAT